MDPFLSPDGRLRSGWRFLIAAFLFIFAEILAQGIAAAFARGPSIHFDAWYRPLALILLLICFSFMVRFLDHKPGNPIAAQGLGTRGRWLLDIFRGLLLGGGLIAIAMLAIAFLGDFSLSIHINPATVKSAMLVLWVLATAAMLEEVTFRGYPFQCVIEGLGPIDRFFRLPSGVGAIAVMSILFGAVHLGNPHSSRVAALNTVLVGVLLSTAYLRTRTLWMPFGIHLGWNAALGTVFGLPVSGITSFAVVVKGTASGANWLTGGDYGLEASATGAAVIILGTFIVTKLVPSRATPDFAGETGSSQNTGASTRASNDSSSLEVDL